MSDARERGRTGFNAGLRSRRARCLLLLGAIFVLGAWFRLSGIYWGERQNLHPDERFMLWVGSDISPVRTLSEYFDTAHSTLNPHNQGHKFYVYGTLPLFLVRYPVEWIYGHSGFIEMENVGRPLSALMDLLTLLLVYVLGSTLYGRRTGILAAAFYACSVLPIQLSHFYKEDTFASSFNLAALCIAAKVATGRAVVRAGRLYFLSILFGLAAGAAAASKLTAVTVLPVLPCAFLLWVLASPEENRRICISIAVRCVLLAALGAFIIFRLTQPYAFSGPGFFGTKLNPAWMSNLRELWHMSSGDVDYPPALQWARRSIFYSGKNMLVWGLGPALGALSCLGCLWMLWKMLGGECRKHIWLWSWAVAFFLWQSIQFNPTMRYQLPVYPAATLFAAWAAVTAFDEVGRAGLLSGSGQRYSRAGVATLIGVIMLATLGWAYAFTRIYSRPITRIEASRWIYQNVPGPINLRIGEADAVFNHPLPFPANRVISASESYTVEFRPEVNGSLLEVYLPYISEPSDLRFALQDGHGSVLLASERIQIPQGGKQDKRGVSGTLRLVQPIPLRKGQVYRSVLSSESTSGGVKLAGSAPAHETSWDDGLPLRMDGYDPYGGLLRGDLNLEMYWDDNAEKLKRILTVLDQADFLFITSNRQWGSIPRVPERYPLGTAFYKHLLGCPDDRDITWCYSVAQAADWKGALGFELVKIFESQPSLGPVKINDQFADEAFTVYDHPKVFVFKKSSDYESERVKSVLGVVDLSRVISVTPRRASLLKRDLCLPSGRLMKLREGGTWAELFPASWSQNRSQVLAVLLWYLSLLLLGLLTYPIVRAVLPGLPDRGYPISRISGVLLLSYLVWIAGSFQIPVVRSTISAAVGVLALAGGTMAYVQRSGLRLEWRRYRSRILAVEALFLLFFAVGLLLRIANPDLWHPWRGGEKPMDFSFLNAVLKSTSFPPYDPWYAGGFINYYYYGFVLLGVVIKWLGITPAVGFNLILPTLLAMIATAAYSIGWNLRAAHAAVGELVRVDAAGKPCRLSRFQAGLVCASAVVLAGNLATVRMVLDGFVRLGAGGAHIDGAGWITHASWLVQGLIRWTAGSALSYDNSDWYWQPSRAIPALHEVAPITEFPCFTILQGDPHAHLLALPVTFVVLCCALSFFLLARKRTMNWRGWIGGLLFCGMATGALRAANTWDFYPYLLLACFASAYSAWRLVRRLSIRGKMLLTFAGPTILIAVATVLYQPYLKWYIPTYISFEFWKGSRTTPGAYLTHWGLFLFAVMAWMILESRDWMANTPLSALRVFRPYTQILWIAVLSVFLVVTVLVWIGVSIAWFVLPLLAWAALLMLRPRLHATKRFVLLLVITALCMTLMVEIVTLAGDVGRMNTVFKFYMQAWTMLAIGAAAALAWMWPAMRSGASSVWQVTKTLFMVLAMSATFYPLVAVPAKIKDRIVNDGPHTLDGMAFMSGARYRDAWGEMALDRDAHAIRWMQQNVRGSPVIVEANIRELYHWGSRFSVYTGLPGVAGWEWHVRQQHSALPDRWISERLREIDDFYKTTNADQACAFLLKYDVRYIVLGQQERGYYPGDGLGKFTAGNGSCWKPVYHEGDTVIYEVGGPGVTAPH